jgi:hypothetical protein
MTSALVMFGAGIFTAAASAHNPVSGAAFTTVNESVDGTGHCKNGNPNVNCNIYDGKQYVWLNGGPISGDVGDGTYFFAVLDPGSQANPNDGSPGNLSSPHDAYTNRTFTISGTGTLAGPTVTYGGTHDFGGSAAIDQNKIRLMPYDDTSNPGGVYILAICSLGNGYPVDPSSCKYDAFKIQTTTVTQGLPLTVTKDAAGAYDNTFRWGISKSVDKTTIDTNGADATFNYTVTVTHDSGTASNPSVSGVITVTNPNVDGSNNTVSVSQVDVVDQLSDGTKCTVTNGDNQTLTDFKTQFDYSCDLSGLPQGQLDNTVTVSWPTQFLDNGSILNGDSADFTFSDIAFTANNKDDCIEVNDTLGGDLGQVCSTDPSPTDLKYSYTFKGDPAGTCTSHDNTATFTTNTSGSTDSASQSVQVCVGADLQVSKDATPSFLRTYSWSISKTVDKTLVKQVGGSATFNYTVTVNQTGFTDSGWKVDGTITVTNPNDWEPITTNVSDAVDNGGSCTVTGGTNVSVPASSSVYPTYECTYSSAPTSSSGTNTATATWDAGAAYTPDASATGTATFAFSTPTSTKYKTATITDTFNGKTTTLGTVTATDSMPFASKTFTYSRTVSVPQYGCVTYPNTAKIVETGQYSSKSVQVCGPAHTGALTMGFWQNKNGQGIISGGSSTSGVCNSGTWLRQYAPFQDLSSTATCSQVATYVYNIIKAANAGGASMNPMLKAQMLATALDVYFSSPAGGNKIGAPAPIGGVAIDLTHIPGMTDTSSGGTPSGGYENVGPAFGGASSLTVSQMLAYAASQSNIGGSSWYGNVKFTQGLAKDAFDAINNQVAFSA